MAPTDTPRNKAPEPTPSQTRDKTRDKTCEKARAPEPNQTRARTRPPGQPASPPRARARWQNRLASAVALSCLGLTAACNNSAPPGPAQATTSARPATTGTGGATGRAGVPVPPPASTPPSAQASEIIRRLAANRPLDADQLACAASRLDAQPDLLQNLDVADPTSAARYDDALNIIGDCIDATTMAGAFAANIDAQTGGTLTATQLACLRDRYAAFTHDQLTGLRQAGLEPAKADPALKTLLDDTMRACGVDPDTISPPTGPEPASPAPAPPGPDGGR